MRKSWAGWVWFGVAVTLIIVSLWTTLWVLAGGFNWDPDDFPAEYYAARIPELQHRMLVAMLVPLLAAAASAISAHHHPRTSRGNAAAVSALVVAFLITCASWALGVYAIDEATDYMHEFGG